ncbi:MAG: branched-chain amino acid ABC transporter permease [Candidatus Rokubacteria bacterium]|nr:branched-chain amino acid ABC transporter permease [Candidatus Rokubacteria bacterium]
MRGWAFIGGLSVLALIPVVVKTPSYLDVLIYVGIYTIVTVGLCLLTGYAGQISLGQAAFYGLGAYTSAILTVSYAIPSGLALIAGMLVTAAVAYGFGIPILKLKGHYLAMATLAFGIIVYLAFVEFKDFTGGPSGIPGVPPFSLFGFAFDSDIKRYYLTTGAALLTLVVARNVVNSRIGRALRSIHGSEVAAETLGVDTARHKLQVFALSAAMASLAGSLYAHHLGLVSPAAFTFVTSVEFVVMAAVGGLASVWGAPFGAATVTILTEGIRRVMPLLLSYASGEHEVIAYGIILIAIMIFMPEGLVVGLRASFWSRRRARG